MDSILDQLVQLVLKNLFAIFTLFLTVLVFPLFISYIQKEYWSPLARKKNIWRQFIIRDSFIKKCVDTYQKVERKSEVPYDIILLIPMLLSIYFLCQMTIYVLLMILVEARLIPLLKIYSVASSQPYDYVFYIVSLFIIFVFTIPLIVYSSWMKSTRDGINLKNYEHSYSDIKVLYYICFLLAVFYSLFIVTFIASRNAESFFFALLLTIPIFMLVNTLSYKKSSTMKIKNIINSIYSARFPCVIISTVGAEHYDGKLINIFDNESIRLIHRKNEIIILWDAVATIMELKQIEGKQKQISSFKDE